MKIEKVIKYKVDHKIFNTEKEAKDYLKNYNIAKNNKNILNNKTIFNSLYDKFISDYSNRDSKFLSAFFKSDTIDSNINLLKLTKSKIRLLRDEYFKKNHKRFTNKDSYIPKYEKVEQYMFSFAVLEILVDKLKKEEIIFSYKGNTYKSYKINDFLCIVRNNLYIDWYNKKEIPLNNLKKLLLEMKYKTKNLYKDFTIFENAVWFAGNRVFDFHKIDENIIITNLTRRADCFLLLGACLYMEDNYE